MPFKGIVKLDDQMEIRFHADPNNAESSALLTGHVPDGVHPPPPPDGDMVAPGGVVSQHVRVRPALSIKITVDAPDGGGGLLETFVNGKLRHKGQVSDVIWTYGIA